MKKTISFVLSLFLSVVAYAQVRPVEIPFGITVQTFEDVFAAYYKKENILDFAKCQVFSPDEKHSYFLPFLFLRTLGRRPVAVDYSHDIDVKSSMIFISDPESALEKSGEIESGKIILLFDILPIEATRERKSKLILEKLKLAENLRAKALVIIPDPDKPYQSHPHYSVDYNGSIPAISIAYEDAEKIFSREQLDLKKIWEEQRTKKETAPIVPLRQKMRIYLHAQFAVEEGQHFIIFYHPQSLNSKEVAEIIKIREKAYQFISQEMGIEKTFRHFLFFYPSPEMKTFYTWHVGYSLIWGNQSHEIRNRDIVIDEYYQAALCVLKEVGQPISLLYEGTAVYFANRLEGVYRGKTLEKWMARFLEQESLIPLAQILGFYMESYGHELQVFSPEAGAFVDFLIRDFGMEAFKILYSLITKGGEANIQKNVEILELVCNKDFKELEEEWITQYGIHQNYKNAYLEKSRNTWEQIRRYKFSEHLAQKLNEDETNASLWLEWAYYLNNERKYRQAVKALQKYLKLNPEDFQGIGLLGLTYYLAGEFENAEKKLEEAIALQPQSLLPHYYLSLVKMSLGKWQQAKTEMIKVLEIAPQGPFARKAQAYLSEIIYY